MMSEDHARARVRRLTDRTNGYPPVHMYVCEIARLILYPEQLYVFHVHPECPECRAYGGTK